MPVIRDDPVLAVGRHRLSAQNVLDRYNVDDWLWLLLLKELGARVGDLPPPFRQRPAGWIEIWHSGAHAALSILYLYAKRVI